METVNCEAAAMMRAALKACESYINNRMPFDRHPIEALGMARAALHATEADATHWQSEQERELRADIARLERENRMLHATINAADAGLKKYMRSVSATVALAEREAGE